LGTRRRVAAALREARVHRDLLVDEVLDAVGLLDAVPPRLGRLERRELVVVEFAESLEHALLPAQLLHLAEDPGALRAPPRLDRAQQLLLLRLIGAGRLQARGHEARLREVALVDPALRLVAAPLEGAVVRERDAGRVDARPRRRGAAHEVGAELLG